MRYNVIKINDTQWAVKVGRSTKGGYQYFKTSVSTSEAQVTQECAHRNAQDLIAKATELAKLVTLDNQMRLAQDANEICRDYEARALEEDPEFNPMDSRGYLC